MKRSPLPRSNKPIKRTPLARGTKPIPKKRKTPRRGRVIDKPRMLWAETQPCCITGELPATTHHVREFGGPKNDTRIIRLVARLHMKTHANSSVLPCIEDGKERFERMYEVSIEEEIAKLRSRYTAETGRP